MCDSSRPILGVGGLNRGISQIGHPVSCLLILLQFVVPILKLLCLGVVQLIQNSGQAVESFGFIWIGLDSYFPVLDGLSCFSHALKVLPQKVLCVRIVGMKRDDFLP